MRYTRYDYNKKNKWNFAMSLILVIIAGSLIGIILFKVLFKNVNGVINNYNVPNATGTVSQNVKDDSNNKFVILQCGVFQNMDNAKVTLNTIPASCTPFIVKDEQTYKVMAGVYTKDQENTKVNELNKVSIESYTINCEISDGKDTNLQSEIIRGYLEIINKLSDKEVKSINTKEFKAWVNKVSNKSQSSRVKTLVDKANTLPQECNKDNVNDLLVFLYNVLIQSKS